MQVNMGCAINMTFYKLSGTLKAIVIVDKIDEKNIEKGSKGGPSFVVYHM